MGSISFAVHQDRSARELEFDGDPHGLIPAIPEETNLPLAVHRKAPPLGICGDIMTMPGLPRVPFAEAMHLREDGQIKGLF